MSYISEPAFIPDLKYTFLLFLFYESCLNFCIHLSINAELALKQNKNNFCFITYNFLHLIYSSKIILRDLLKFLFDNEFSPSSAVAVFLSIQVSY